MSKPKKLRITLEVDPSAMFDFLKGINGSTDGLGFRMAGLLMTGKITGLDAVGLAMYGVTHVKTTSAPPAEAEAGK